MSGYPASIEIDIYAHYFARLLSLHITTSVLGEDEITKRARQKAALEAAFKGQKDKSKENKDKDEKEKDNNSSSDGEDGKYL